MKKVLIVLGGIVGVFVVLIAGFGFYITRGLKEGQKIVVGEFDVSHLEDGVYNGKYSNGRFSNQVSVTVKDKKITDIAVVKSVTFERPELTGELFADIVKKQSADVDAMSGSTVTRNAYLKAIENAIGKQ